MIHAFVAQRSVSITQQSAREILAMKNVPEISEKAVRKVAKQISIAVKPLSIAKKILKKKTKPRPTADENHFLYRVRIVRGREVQTFRRIVV